MAIAKPNCFQLYCSEVTSQVYIIGSKGVPRKRTAFTPNRRWQVPVCLVLHHIRSTMFSAIIPTRPTVADSPKLDMKEFNFRGCGYHQDRRQCSNASFLSQYRVRFGNLVFLLLFSISAAVVLFLSDVFRESGNTGGLGLWKRVADNTQDNSFVNHKWSWEGLRNRGLVSKAIGTLDEY